MPFKSQKQMAYMWAVHPDIARRWAEEYPGSTKNLPMYSRRKKKSAKKSKNPKNSYFTNDVLLYIKRGKNGRIEQSVIRHFSNHLSSSVRGAITRLKKSGKIKTVQGKVKRV